MAPSRDLRDLLSWSGIRIGSDGLILELVSPDPFVLNPCRSVCDTCLFFACSELSCIFWLPQPNQSQEGRTSCGSVNKVNLLVEIPKTAKRMNWGLLEIYSPDLTPDQLGNKYPNIELNNHSYSLASQPHKTSFHISQNQIAKKR